MIWVELGLSRVMVRVRHRVRVSVRLGIGLGWVPVNSYPSQVVPCQLVPKPTRT